MHHERLPMSSASASGTDGSCARSPKGGGTSVRSVPALARRCPSLYCAGSAPRCKAALSGVPPCRTRTLIPRYAAVTRATAARVWQQQQRSLPACWGPFVACAPCSELRNRPRSFPSGLMATGPTTAMAAVRSRARCSASGSLLPRIMRRTCRPSGLCGPRRHPRPCGQR